MPLLKGMLLSFSDPVLGLVPTVVLFQYNPGDVTRTFTGPASPSGSAPGAGAARAAPRPAAEDYTIKLELDATDGLETGGPLTSTLGLRPRLAAIEMLMQPVGSSLLGSLLSLGGPGAGTAIPAAKLPLVLFAWGPTRITPVQLKSLVVRETGFDDLLNPVHATADLGLTVLRKADLPQDEVFARAAADYYQGVREVAAALAVPQVIEMGG
jgi:hypothetical protein